jgi:replicative DNA helicase
VKHPQEPSSDAPRSYADEIDAAAAHLERQYLDAAVGRDPLAFVPTGIPRLNDLGLGELGVLTVVGGHSGDGKSTFRKQLAWGAAAAGHRVQEFSLEDTGRVAAGRTLADVMDVDATDLRRLRLLERAEDAPELIARLRAAREAVRDTARRISWSRAHTTEAVFDEIDRRWHGPGGETRLVLLDYAQMFDAEGDERSTERVIARLADRCNRLAGDRWCSVVLFSQITRACVERGRKWFEAASFEARRTGRPLGLEAVQGFRPGEGDLQWSSALGHKSKLVPYIFRPGKWARRLGLTQFKDDTMEVYMDKNTLGQDIQIVTLKFDGSRSRIS